jgi:cytidylate kinase
VPLTDAVDRDETVGSWLSRALLSFGQVGPVLAGATPVPESFLTEDAFRDATEQVLRQHAMEGAVILGRAGAIVLREHPGALHVRLTGPEEGRIVQGMRLEGVDRETAIRHIEETDRAREAYVRHFYRCDARDAALYHLVVDSTAIPLGACADLIVEAAQARRGAF